MAAWKVDSKVEWKVDHLAPKTVVSLAAQTADTKAVKKVG